MSTCRLKKGRRCGRRRLTEICAVHDERDTGSEKEAIEEQIFADVSEDVV